MYCWTTVAIIWREWWHIVSENLENSCDIISCGYHVPDEEFRYADTRDTQMLDGVASCSALIDDGPKTHKKPFEAAGMVKDHRLQSQRHLEVQSHCFCDHESSLIIYFLLCKTLCMTTLQDTYCEKSVNTWKHTTCHVGAQKVLVLSVIPSPLPESFPTNAKLVRLVFLMVEASITAQVLEA